MVAREDGAVAASDPVGDRLQRLEEVIESIQTELAFQGQSVQALNDALANQQADILLLKRQITHLSEQLKAIRELAPSSSDAAEADQPPPHY